MLNTRTLVVNKGEVCTCYGKRVAGGGCCLFLGLVLLLECDEIQHSALWKRGLGHVFES
jgi:hypothetical protein